MGRPRAVSSTDLNRAIAAMKAAGIALEQLEVVVEPGRVRIITKSEVAPLAKPEHAQPKEWPNG